MRLGEQVLELVMGGKPGDEKNKLGLLLFFAIGFVLLVLFSLVVVWVDGSQGTAGPLGDFFGGMLNPVLSFLAFAGVLYSIHLQRIDLRDSQIEAKRQQFEATFFQLLAQHDRIVQALDIRHKEHGPLSLGRDCFLSFTKALEDDFRAFMTTHHMSLDDAVTAAYNQMWQHKRQDLGHYFRFLYNTIRYVDEARLPRFDGEADDPRDKYMRILRAQLSDYELAMIFFNCYNERGRKLKPYVRRYNLLDNLSPEVFEFPSVLDLRAGMGKVGELPAIAETVEASMPHGGQAVGQ